jgi:hypothetical protein
MRRLCLRDGIAKSFCIFTDAAVPGDDRRQRRRFAEQLRGREVNGVERANGFDWERPADPCQHGVCNGHHVTATFEPPKCEDRRTLLLRRQSSADPGPKDGSSRFRESQR